MTDFVREPGEVYVAEPRPLLRAMEHTMRGRGLRKDPRIGPASHRHAGKAVADPEDILEGGRHRTHSGAACEHKRAVDVEKEESLDRASADQPSLRTFPARGPFADGSSSKLTRWPSFSWSKLPCTELR